MLESGEKYIHGSTAEKIQYDVYEENKVLKSKKRARQNSKQKLKVVFSILLVFIACTFVMYRYARITELSYNIHKANKKYETLRNENVNLKVQIEKETDLNKIREIAVSKLGMQKPDRYQMVYIKVAKNDHTKVADSYNKNKKSKSQTGSFAILLDKVGKFTRFLE